MVVLCTAEYPQTPFKRTVVDACPYGSVEKYHLPAPLASPLTRFAGALPRGEPWKNRRKNAALPHRPHHTVILSEGGVSPRSRRISVRPKTLYRGTGVLHRPISANAVQTGGVISASRNAPSPYGSVGKMSRCRPFASRMSADTVRTDVGRGFTPAAECLRMPFKRTVEDACPYRLVEKYRVTAPTNVYEYRSNGRRAGVYSRRRISVNVVRTDDRWSPLRVYGGNAAYRADKCLLQTARSAS